MARRSLLRSLVPILLLAISAVAAACGGSDRELTLEEYFLRFQELGNTADERTAALADQLDLVPENQEERLATFEVWFADSLDVQRDFLKDLDKVNPPVEVESAHKELLLARGALMDDFADLFGDLESPSELEEALLGQPEGDLIAAEDRNFEACNKLQTIADDNGIDVRVLDYCG